jgi:hypothetical protein
MEVTEMNETILGLKAIIAKLKAERPDDQDSLKKLQFLLDAQEQPGPYDAHVVGTKFLELFPDEVKRMQTFAEEVAAAALKKMEASVVERATASGTIKK